MRVSECVVREREKQRERESAPDRERDMMKVV